jgi:hypothetical protein
VSDKEIKVTDKRMFTPEGELREEYRFLDEKSTTAEPAPEAAPAPQAPPAPPPRPEPPARMAPEPRQEPRGERAERSDPRVQGRPPAPATSAASAASAAPPIELPGSPPGLGAPTFYDLAAILAEPVALYLGDLELEDGQSAENLEMARMHLDLLDVLRQKTAGNLTAQEAAFLEDLLYRLRVRYVQKRG